MQTDGRIILIDSHSRGLQGEPVASGSAMFIHFDDLDDVCLYLVENNAGFQLNLSPIEFNVISGDRQHTDSQRNSLNEITHWSTLNSHSIGRKNAENAVYTRDWHQKSCKQMPSTNTP